MMMGQRDTDSYEWLKDVEMEDVEDSKIEDKGAPPETETACMHITEIR